VSPWLVPLGVSLAATTVLALFAFSLSRERNVLKRRVEQSSRELERLQKSFARFAPAVLVERIVDKGMLQSGERREVTVMFADIRGFTSLSEKLDAAVVIEMLNGYFSRMSEVIREHHGHVTRVMGDGIMSVFGALESNPWHAQDAVEAAISMRRSLAEYNEKMKARGLPELGFGIGIHCGPVVTGLVGSDDLLEFTVMGDVVNVASRVEGLTRELNADILVTEQVKTQLGNRLGVSAMPPARIRGKTDPILTWTIPRDPAP
jgi:class 3 adenylate cyclase